MTTGKPPSQNDSNAPRSEAKHGGQFVERMFSGFGHSTEFPKPQAQAPAEEPFGPLRQSRAQPGENYRLQVRTPELRVQANSPATDVMTDLSRVEAVTISPDAGVDDAQKTMIARRVRSLFVVDGAVIVGIITSNDISGERPIQVAQQRGARHADILVREVMTPADLLEAIDLKDVLQARVGDVVETLRRSGRQHALVIDAASGDGAQTARTVRGMFSLTQIARQLGLPPHVGGNVARTFAEIEAAIGA